MTISRFHDMYVAELQELRDAEGQFAVALEPLCRAASNPDLATKLLAQREETKACETRLHQMLQRHGANPKAHKDQAMRALVRETEKMAAMVEGDELRDSALIASTQKLAHYQIAAFGTAAALAGQLGLRDDQKSLHAGLEALRHADRSLTDLAKREINPEAVAA